MKNLALAFLAGVLIVAACKKQNNPQPAAKTYLLSKSTFVNGSVTYDYFYSYDSLDRLTELNSSYTSTIFKFTYDDQNHLLTAGSYDYTNQLDAMYKFSYNGNIVTAGFYDSGGTTLFLTYSITLNSSGLPTTVSGFNQPATFTYDAAGNITQFKSDGGGISNATFDTKKNPSSGAIGKNYFLMYFLTRCPPTPQPLSITHLLWTRMSIRTPIMRMGFQLLRAGGVRRSIKHLNIS